MSRNYDAKDWSSVRVTAALLAIVTLVVGIGALFVMPGRELLLGSTPSLLLVTVAIVATGIGWILLELVGGAMLELIVRPVLELIVRPVWGLLVHTLPQSIQDRLTRVVGGPLLLVGILVFAVLTILAISLWITA